MSFSPEEKRVIKEAAANFQKQKEAWSKDKIEVFEQLLKLKPFIEWSKDNVVISRDVDHISREIRIAVIYKGEYEGIKTSLQRLEEIKDLINDKFEGTKEELETKILEIINFDEMNVVETEEKEETEEN